MRRTSPLVLFILLAGAAGAAPEGRPSGKLRIALVGAVETLDPAKAASEPARVCVTNLYDQLYEYHPHARPYELRPCLAQAMPEVSEDGTTVTVRLRSGVRYADDPCFADGTGREVTADDVVFCLLRLMDARVQSPARWMLERKIVGLDEFAAASAGLEADPRGSDHGPAAGYPAVTGLTAPDARTLRFRLHEPMPELVWLLAGAWTSVYPPEAVRTYGLGFGSHPVTCGPYRVTIFLPPHTLLLQRSPVYREDRSPGPDGASGSGALLPLHEQVEIRAHEQPLGAWSAFQVGDADCAEVPRDAFTAVVDPASGRALPWVTKRGITLHRDPRLEILYDAFNLEDPVLGTSAGARGRALRRAICLLGDDTWAMTRLYTHQSERIFGPLLPEFEGYDRTFRNDWLPEDGEEREDLIAAAREVLRLGGIEDPGSVPALRMHVLDDPTSGLVFGQLRGQLAEIGLRLEPVPVKWPELQRLLREKQAQMWTSSWYADYPDAQNFLQLFYGPNAPDPNASNHRSKHFDELYREARRAPSRQEREDHYRAMQRLVTDACPWRYRFRRIRWSATQAWLTGYRHNDVAPKHFKHCHPDESLRAQTLAGWK